MPSQTPYRHRRTKFPSLIAVATLAACLVFTITGAVRLNGLLPGVSATPVHHATSPMPFANAHGVKRSKIALGDALQEKQDVEGDKETGSTTPPSTVFETLEGDASSDQFEDRSIYVIGLLHARGWNLDSRAANQSTKHMGEGYVKLKQEINGGYIVLSVIIAFVGSLCTLELLLRR